MMARSLSIMVYRNVNFIWAKQTVTMMIVSNAPTCDLMFWRKNLKLRNYYGNETKARSYGIWIL
jgi:hypothetical protein